jgi:hypothetical protein
MEEWAEVNVSASEVWAAWQFAIEKGGKRVVQICPGQSFTLVWSSFLSRIFCTHMVKENGQGALIGCKIEIKGFFAPLLRRILRSKIKKNSTYIVQSMAARLIPNVINSKNPGIKETGCGGCP